MISKTTIQQIYDTSDIHDIVSDFVNLRKRGVNFVGLCPFHNEKTPSFTVSPARGIYKCFGCGKGGNAINFVMEHEQMDYSEALRFLAKKYHIEIVETSSSPERIQKKEDRESMLVMTSFAQNFFIKSLHEGEVGKIAYAYLVERNIKHHIIEKFKIGYSPDTNNSLSTFAQEKGFNKKYLIKSGLSFENKNELIDRFRGRIIFPIHSISGKVVGFGGRILANNAKIAKYINSPESEIYQKGRLLYGLYFAKRSITKLDKCFLVEGYTDVISLHQSGIENVVASSGTALTIQQIHQIKRFTNNISVIFDGDEAGIKASLRNIDLILSQDVNIKAVQLPKGKDPDTFVMEKNAAEVQKYLQEKEQDFISYKTELLLSESLNDPLKKANTISEIVRSISLIPNQIVRAEYIKNSSALFDVTEKTLYAELSRYLIDKNKRSSQLQRRQESKIFKNATNLSVNPCENEEKELIRCLLIYGNMPFKLIGNENQNISIANYIFDEIENDGLESEGLNYKIIFEDYRKNMDDENFDAIKYFRHHPKPDIINVTVNILADKHQLSQIWKKNDKEDISEKISIIVIQLLNGYKQKKLQILQKELQKRIKTAKKEEDVSQINELIKEKIWVDRTISKIAKQLGDRTIL